MQGKVSLFVRYNTYQQKGNSEYFMLDIKHIKLRHKKAQSNTWKLSMGLKKNEIEYRMKSLIGIEQNIQKNKKVHCIE